MDKDDEFSSLLFEAIGKDTGENKIINKLKNRCLYNTGPFAGKDAAGKALVPAELEHNPIYLARVSAWQEICAWLLFNIKQGEGHVVSEPHTEQRQKEG